MSDPDLPLDAGVRGEREAPVLLERAQLTPGAQRLSIILLIVAAGFLASVFFHYEVGAVRGRGYPLNTFLFRPSDQFMDHYGNSLNAELIQQIGTPGSTVRLGMPSPPMMMYALALYHFFHPHAMFVGWAIVTGTFLAGTLYFVMRSIRAVTADSVLAKTLILTLCSYPVLMSLDRTNFENLIFLLLALAIFAYRQGRAMVTAIALGVIIAMKPYAVVFLPLFAADRQFKALFTCGAVAALVAGICLALVPGDVPAVLAYLKKSLALYNDTYALGNEGLYFGSSLWGLYKVLLFLGEAPLEDGPGGVGPYLAQAMSAYFWFAAAAFAVIAAVICFCRMSLWKTAALLVCSMNLLPFVCADYRLMHLFIPMLLFIEEKEKTRDDVGFALLFGLLLIPTSYIHLSFHPALRVNPLEVSDSVIIHPLLMLLLVTTILLTVLRRPEPTDLGLWFAQMWRRVRPGATLTS